MKWDKKKFEEGRRGVVEKDFKVRLYYQGSKLARNSC